nr:cobalamin-dependent protein [Trinickia violacea]
MCGEHDIHKRQDAGDRKIESTEKNDKRRSSRRDRRPCILIAKLGQDGHDRGAAVVASALADAGYEVMRAPLFQQPVSVADSVQSEGVDIVGVSSLSGAHLELVGRLLDELASRGLPTRVVVGGIVPGEHAAELASKGVSAIFGPGTSLEAIVESLCECIEQACDAARVGDCL